MKKLEQHRIIMFSMSNRVCDSWVFWACCKIFHSYNTNQPIMSEVSASPFSWEDSVTFYLTEYMHNFWPVKSHNSWEERIIQISNNLLQACLILGFTVSPKWALDSQSVFYSKKSKEGCSSQTEETLSCLLLLHNTRVFHASSQQGLTWKCLKGYSYHSRSAWYHNRHQRQSQRETRSCAYVIFVCGFSVMHSN